MGRTAGRLTLIGLRQDCGRRPGRRRTWGGNGQYRLPGPSLKPMHSLANSLQKTSFTSMRSGPLTTGRTRA
jgi:hypothetical protein